jgi:hypothetical protein
MNAPNDPRITFDEWWKERSALILTPTTRRHEESVSRIAWNAAQTPLLAELDRLCGPICPFDQKRAIEHHLRRSGGGVALWERVDITDHSCSAARGEGARVTHAGACWYCGDQLIGARQQTNHQPAPEIEAWLRAHR